MAQNDLIPAFGEILSTARTHITQRNIEAAKESYAKLRLAYDAISKSSLETLHKQIAYDQLVKIYHELGVLSQAPKHSQIFTGKDIMVIGILLIMLSMVVLFKPEYVGLSVSDFTQNHAPVWKAESTTLSLPANTASTVDLNKYFYDPDGDELAFVVPEIADVSVMVTGDSATIVPGEGVLGARPMTIIATDMNAVTRTRITVEFKQ